MAPKTYICGFCSNRVSSNLGYYAEDDRGQIAYLRICPSCSQPTFFFQSGEQCPRSAPGTPVHDVPPDVSVIYEEARQCATVGAYTGSAMLCRKILMNIAVSQGAEAGETFKYYVEFLAQKGFIPPHGDRWVDYIRSRGNEANHEIEVVREKDAIALIMFVEMLLRFIYEFPSLVPDQEKREPSK